MKYLITTAFIIFNTISWAQILHPADWEFEVSGINPKVGDTVDLIFNATIEDDWYLYSSDFDPNLGPLVTEFTFEPDPTYELIGDIQPQNPKTKYDSLWEGEHYLFQS